MSRYPLPALRRQSARNRVARVAFRAGYHDASGTLGNATLAALRATRALAAAAGCDLDEVDDVTIGAVEHGRGVAARRAAS